jgi:prepilin-type N-terminal cleavage/methylation domain-containing protein
MRANSEQSGFTLIEILVAISIFASITVVLYSSATGVVNQKQLLDDRRSLELLSEQVMGRMVRELSVSQGSSGQHLLPPPGSSGDARLATALRTDVATVDNAELDSISFITTNTGQYIPGVERHWGPIQITYRAAKDPESPTGLSLVREETPIIQPPEKAYQKTVRFPITNQITGLRFRLYDANRRGWEKVWGDTAARTTMPAMIEIQISLRASRGLASTYTTTVTPESNG